MNQSWTEEKILNLYHTPFFELVQRAYQQHRQQFPDSDIELCTLASIKTGACPEDCAYCPQSAHYQTGLKKEKLLSLETVLAQAKQAKENGSQRFCLGAAWREPPTKEFPIVLKMIAEIKALGLETCATLGMLTLSQAQALKAAGLDYYNHNLDCSESFYPTIITTRTYQQRLTTINHVIAAGLHVCCGGIIGMGESLQDRIQLLLTLYQLPQVPLSIPINRLIPITGTPLAEAEKIDDFSFIRMIACTRLMFPTAKIRLAAGRETMSETLQAWCYMAGVNSIFIGEKLLTAKNVLPDFDKKLLEKINLCQMPSRKN